VDSTNRLLK
jgi:hypothetical protein